MTESASMSAGPFPAAGDRPARPDRAPADAARKFLGGFLALRPRSIRAKLLLVFVAAMVVPMGVLGVVYYATSTQAVGEMAGNRTARLAQSVQTELDQRLRLRSQDRLLATNHPVQAFLAATSAGDVARTRTVLRELREYFGQLFLQYGEYYDELILADAAGEPVFRYERGGGSFARGERLVSPGAPSLGRQTATDVGRDAAVPPGGTAVAGSGFRYLDRERLRTGTTIAPGETRLQVDPIEAGSVPAASVLMPVQSNTLPEQRLGYVLARIRQSYLWPADLASRRFGEHGELAILSRDGGDLLYHTRQAWIGHRLEDVDRPLAEVASAGRGSRGAGPRWIGGPDGRRVVTVLDAGFAPWRIVSAAHPGEFAVEARRAALLNLALALTVLLGAATLLVVVGGRVSRSIQRVTLGAQRIAGGDLLGPPVRSETHDEIETLADSFNQMTESLRRNIAMREQTAAELDALNRTLESRVLERTRELESLNAVLNRANEDLKELDRLKTNFLATVSHEFKTPLTSIKAFAEILHDELADRGASDELMRFLRIIDTESERLARLIKNVLDLSRIESGRMVWRRVSFPIAEVVEAAIDGLLPALRAKQIRIERHLACGDTRFTGDPDRIQEVFNNVLDNAIKASPEGHRIVIDGREVPPSRAGEPRALRISVTDEGPGIAPDQLERVFDRFYQSNAGSRRQGGTGLGLAISREIAEYHGGRIWAENASGRGSTFHVQLPLGGAPDPSPGPEPRPALHEPRSPEEPPHA